MKRQGERLFTLENINTRDEHERGSKRLRAVFGESAPKLDVRMTTLTHEEFLVQAGVHPEPTPDAAVSSPTPP